MDQIATSNHRGSFNQLVSELQLESKDDFLNYAIMPVDAFNRLLHMANPYIEKHNISACAFPLGLALKLSSVSCFW